MSTYNDVNHAELADRLRRNTFDLASSAIDLYEYKPDPNLSIDTDKDIRLLYQKLMDELEVLDYFKEENIDQFEQRLMNQPLAEPLPDVPKEAQSVPTKYTLEDLKNFIAGVVPGVGDAMAGEQAIQDVQQGDYASAMMNAAGVLPFVPALGGVIRPFMKRAGEPPPNIQGLETATLDLASNTAATRPGGMHFQTLQELQDFNQSPLKRVESGFYHPQTGLFYTREQADIAAGFPEKVADEIGVQGLGSQTLMRRLR